jgi:hypothetical protein
MLPPAGRRSKPTSIRSVFDHQLLLGRERIEVEPQRAPAPGDLVESANAAAALGELAVRG